jgi:hypothetical protein
MKAALSDEEEQKAFERKNRQDPDPNKRGKAKMVATEEKDACYHKVKSRYSVWPSAYASGALVKCRKVGAKNWGNKKKTFKEFFEEVYLIEAQRYFSSRSELEKHHGGIPSGYYANNAGSTENPKWRLKPKSGGVGERGRRKERIENLSSSEERRTADTKIRKLKSKGLEAHHITPLHYSSKLKSSMSDAEWKERVKKDASQGVYHGHHPRNIMGAKRSTDPSDKPGIYHRKGGAHEIESKTKDIVSGSIPHKELLSAAVRRQKKKAKAKS